MKTISMLVLAVIMMLSAPVAFAGEHGGKEHGGSASKEHGGSHGGSHGASPAVETLMEAAMELKGSNPELAAKLKALAHEM